MRSIICNQCKNKTKHHALGLCIKCYQKAYQKTKKYKAYKNRYMKIYRKSNNYQKYKSEYMKAYNKTDKFKAYQRAWYQKNKERLKKNPKTTKKKR